MEAIHLRGFFDQRFLLGTMEANLPRASCSLVWLGLVPSRFEAFCRLTVAGKISTANNLRRRGILWNSILDTCIICGKERESIDHLLLHCKVTSYLWFYFINLCGVFWYFPGTLASLVAWVWGPFHDCGLLPWRLIPFTILWEVWKERNERIFRNSTSSLEGLVSKVIFSIAKWALVRKDFRNLNVLHACMGCGAPKVKKSIFWIPPLTGILKFNVNGAARGKLGLAGIGGVLLNDKGEVLLMFPKSVGIRDSNEVEVLAILEAFQIFLASFHGPLVVESDSTNVVGWLLKPDSRPWKFQFHFNTLKKISASLVVSFAHVIRRANSMADALAKQGADRHSPGVGFSM